MSIHAVEVPVSRRFGTDPGDAPRHPVSRRLGQSRFLGQRAKSAEDSSSASGSESPSASSVASET